MPRLPPAGVPARRRRATATRARDANQHHGAAAPNAAASFTASLTARVASVPKNSMAWYSSGVMTAIAAVVGIIIVGAYRYFLSPRRWRRRRPVRHREDHKYCPTCNGFGYHRCNVCQGRGVLRWEGKFVRMDPCPKCLGRRVQRCEDCLGLVDRPLFKHLEVPNAYAKGGLLSYLKQVEASFSSVDFDDADLDYTRYRRVLGASAAVEREQNKKQEGESTTFVKTVRSGEFGGVDGFLRNLLRNPNTEREEREAAEKRRVALEAASRDKQPQGGLMARMFGGSGGSTGGSSSNRSLGRTTSNITLDSTEEAMLREGAELLGKRPPPNPEVSPGRRTVGWGGVGLQSID